MVVGGNDGGGGKILRKERSKDRRKEGKIEGWIEGSEN
jgi:hypothetical protein